MEGMEERRRTRASGVEGGRESGRGSGRGTMGVPARRRRGGSEAGMGRRGADDDGYKGGTRMDSICETRRE